MDFEKIAQEAFNDEMKKIAEALSKDVTTGEHALNLLMGGYPSIIQHGYHAEKGKKLNAIMATLGREIGYGTAGAGIGIGVGAVGSKAADAIKNDKIKAAIKVISTLAPTIGGLKGSAVGYKKAREALVERGAFGK